MVSIVMPVQRAALSGMKYPTRESPARDAASPISTTNLVATSKEPVCPRVELLFKIIIILLIIFLGFIKSKPC